MSDELDEYQRFFTGGMSPVEEAAFRQRLESQGGDSAALDSLRQAIRARESPINSAHVSASWRDLQKRIAAAERDETRERRGVTHRSHQYARLRRLATVAAAIVVAAVIGWMAMPTMRMAPTLTVEVPRGAPFRKIALPDSTSVTVAPGSKLQLAAHFDGSSREVVLYGAAAFEVRHDATRPFRVHVGSAIAEDIGTRFVVDAFDSNTVNVAVESGRVAVRSDVALPATLLVAGRAARIDQVHRLITVHEADPIVDFGWWTTGVLTFRAAPLADVASVLDRVYDVDIRFNDPTLGQEVLNLPVRAGASVDDVLTRIGTVVSARVKRNGRVVTFSRITPSPPHSSDH